MDLTVTIAEAKRIRKLTFSYPDTLLAILIDISRANFERRIPFCRFQTRVAKLKQVKAYH